METDAGGWEKNIAMLTRRMLRSHASVNIGINYIDVSQLSPSLLCEWKYILLVAITNLWQSSPRWNGRYDTGKDKKDRNFLFFIKMLGENLSSIWENVEYVYLEASGDY